MPLHISVLQDDISGTTPENQVVSTMVLRKTLPDRPIGTLVYSNAATFKKKRMALTAEVQGSLRPRIVITGGATPSRFADGEAATKGERATVSRMLELDDRLMMHPEFETKRQARQASDPRIDRFAELRSDFPRLCDVLDQMRAVGRSNGELYEAFKIAYEEEVVSPKPGPGNSHPVRALVVCLQGPFYDGGYYPEFPDADVYLGHLLGIRDEVIRWSSDVLVLSGGITRPGIPVSEAASTAAWLEERGVLPIHLGAQ